MNSRFGRMSAQSKVQQTQPTRFGTRVIRQVVLLSCALFLFITGAYLYLILEIDRYTKETTQLNRIELTIETVRTALVDQETGQRGYDLTGIDSFLEPFHAGTKAFQQAALQIQQDASPYLTFHAKVAELLQAGEHWHNDYGLPQVRKRQAGQTITAAQLSEGKQAFDAFRSDANQMLAKVAAQQATVQTDTHRFILITFSLTLFVVMVVVVLLILLLIRLVRKTIEPITTLSYAISEYATADFDTALEFNARNDEIGQLTKHVEIMRKNLKHTFRLNNSLVRLGRELQLVQTQSEVYDSAIHTVAALWDCDCTLMTREGDTFSTILRYEQGVTMRADELLRSTDMQTIVQVFQEGKTRFFPNWNILRPSGVREARRYEAGYRSSIHVAITHYGACLAVLNLGSKVPNYFEEGDVELCAQIGSLLGLALKNAEVLDEYQRHARLDGLTNLSNRRHFDQILAREIEHAASYHAEFSVVLLDIDHFKRFNDTYGHLEGDKILQNVAKILASNARPNDTVARFGGEEFVVLLVDTDLEQAYRFAERLRHEIESQFVAGYRVTCSFGVANYQPNLTDQALIARADTSLYKAKELGRNRVEVSAVSSPT